MLKHPEGCIFANGQQNIELDEGWSAYIHYYSIYAPITKDIAACKPEECLFYQKLAVAKKWFSEEKPEQRYSFDSDCKTCGGGAFIVFYPPES